MEQKGIKLPGKTLSEVESVYTRTTALGPFIADPGFTTPEAPGIIKIPDFTRTFFYKKNPAPRD